MRYRPDIDGLRSVAVLPVILFHAGFETFSGGFVGVDVFFVISGYLITSIVIAEHVEGRFSFRRFYERRARRILPALFFVILCCLPFAWAWMMPYEFEEFGRSIAATMLFVSNVFFWMESDYFAASAELKPLLHTWSLAIEEQYYFILPCVVFLALRGGMRMVWGVLAGCAALSFLLMLAIVFVFPHGPLPSANFYLLPSRAWELLAGSLLAVFLLRREPPQGPVAAIGGLIGLAMIVGSILLLDDTVPFPSHWTLLPVIGTVMVLLCGTAPGGVGWILGWRPLVGIGLISYSAYLWHQPIFAFARLRMGEHVDPVVMAGLAVLSLLLAWATWRFVERPFRDRDRIGSGMLFGGLATASVAFLAVGITVDARGGLPERYPAFQREWVSVTPVERGDYVRGAYEREALDRPLATDRPNVVLLGDSFSQDLYNMIAESGAFEGYAISAIYRPVQCQLAINGDDFEAIQGSWRAACRQAVLEPQELVRLREADVVLVALAWKPWSATRAMYSLAALGLDDHAGLYVLGSKYGLFSRSPRDVLHLDPLALSEARVEPSAKEQSVNAILRDVLPEDRFIDLHAVFCEDDGSCPVFGGEGDLLSYDGGHLTQEGAVALGARLFSETPLRAYGPANVNAALILHNDAIDMIPPIETGDTADAL